MTLLQPIEKMPRVGPVFASRLKKLGINTLQDFLFHIPFRYENFSLLSKINQVQPGETVTIQGKVLEIKNIYSRHGKILQKAQVEDETGTIEIIWFNQPFLIRSIKTGNEISLSGKTELFAKKITLVSPEYEIVSGPTIHTGRLVPVYPETRGISSKWLRRQIWQILLEQRQNLLEYLPSSIIKEQDFIGFRQALEQIHFPKTVAESEQARLRLSFDELFLTQLAARERKNQWEENLSGHAFKITAFEKNIQTFWEKLPFELTRSQKKAVGEIFADLKKPKPMNRLLEGDVGSGKTVVAAIAMYLAFLNGFQSVLMAPTEILAQQHFQTISNLLFPLGVKIDLVTGSKKLKISNFTLRQTQGDAEQGRSIKFQILIGTHAVLSKKINFANLGLVIIDEQQRFGVTQRALIRQKGQSPHFLTMTATPIPRTVALTLYGDLDLSFLEEMPASRKRIKTWLVPPEKRTAAYRWIEKEIKEKVGQVFFICPLIEESETLTSVRAATAEFEKLKTEVFPNLKLGLLHGRMKAGEKEKVLALFKKRGLDILIATPVVEVGIDVPGATVIVIEAAERFGLSQLHQLRGRVGRNDKQSFCLLFSESKNEMTLKRLKEMERINVGAELAELDLKLRGPGEIYGTRQHGLPELKVASFSDFPLIEKARREAEKIFPELGKHPLLQEKLTIITPQKISPD